MELVIPLAKAKLLKNYLVIF